jgi:hypothetical protein
VGNEREDWHTGLALEAMDILSNGRINKVHKERLKEIIKAICEQVRDTRTELRALELAGLNGKDKRKLSKLEAFHGRVFNIQVCQQCKPYFEEIINETGKRM